MENIFSDNKDLKQYELIFGTSKAKIEYIIADKRIYLTHTEVPLAAKGHGIGSSIVKQALEDIENRKLVLKPLCPFVSAYIKRHPEWKRLL